MGQSIGWSRTGCKSTPNACAPLPQTTERIEIMERPGRRAEASQLSPSSLTVILSQRFPGIAGGIEVISDSPGILDILGTRKRNTRDTHQDILIRSNIGAGDDRPVPAIPVFDQCLEAEIPI